MTEKRETEVTLKNVRISFAHIFRPQQFQNGEGDPKYNATFLIPKENTKAVAAVKAALRAAAVGKWGDTLPSLKADRICLRDGDGEGERPEYAHCYYLPASNARRPVVVDRDRSPLVEEDGRPYSGCYVNVVVNLWAQDNKYGKRLNASLEAVQFVRDGEAFGRRPINPESAFDDLGEETDDGDEGAPWSDDEKADPLSSLI